MAKPFSKARSAAIDGRAHNPFYKKLQLKKLHDKLVDSATEIQKAIADDTGHRPAEVKAEYWLAMRCVAETYKSIDPEQHLKDEYAISRSKDARDAREPVGIVVIEPALHTFTFSLLCALSPALAAGNCIIVQVEQTMLKTPSLLLEIIKSALDSDIVSFTSKPVTSADIGHRHVRVLQNGSSSEEPPLANHFVSRSESRVVAVVERGADLHAAAEALVKARFGLRGKSPYSPDVVLVNEWVKREFLSAVMRCSLQFMADTGNDMAAPRGKSGKTFLDEVTKEGLSRIVSSGEYGMVVDIEDRGSCLMQRKLRESCLAINTVTSMDDAIDLSKRFGRLAACFVFTATPSAAKYISQFLDSEITFVNQVPATLLFGPVSPQGKPLDPESFTPYDADLFTLPKPQYISPLKRPRDLNSILPASTARDLQQLDNEATERLPEPKRLKKGGDVGFFNQGVITGGVIFLATVVTCTGALCYYAVKFTRPRLRGL